MSDVGVSDAFAFGLLLVYILYFLVGFIPGFYLSYLFFAKIFKKQHPYFILFYFILGIIISPVGYSIAVTLIFALEPYNKILASLSLPSIVLLELLFVIFHFFYFRKRQKRKSK